MINKYGGKSPSEPRRGGVKPETKSALSEAQVRSKAETYIETIVKRTRAATKAKTKANS